MPITVGVPLFDPHKKFLPHFIEWYAYNKFHPDANHDLRLAWAQRAPLHDAQAGAVLLARETGSSHVLFVEDDHWAFPIDGLKELLAQDKDVIGFSTLSRNYPYHTLNMKKIDPRITMIQKELKNMSPVEYVKGRPLVQEMDLISWAFTLVKIDVFDRIPDPFLSWGQVPTDSVFCQYCEDAGIKRHVHFGYTVPHGEATLELRPLLQRVDQWRRAIEGHKGGSTNSKKRSKALTHVEDYAKNRISASAGAAVRDEHLDGAAAG